MIDINKMVNYRIREIIIDNFTRAQLVKSVDIIEGIEIYTFKSSKIKQDNLTNDGALIADVFVTSGCACAIGGIILIGDQFDEKVRKFLIGHELGHIKHGDNKLTIPKYLKNIVSFLFTKKCTILDNYEKEILADEYARNFCGYSITVEEFGEGILANYKYILDNFEERKEDIKSYIFKRLSDSRRF